MAISYESIVSNDHAGNNTVYNSALPQPVPGSLPSGSPVILVIAGSNAIPTSVIWKPTGGPNTAATKIAETGVISSCVFSFWALPSLAPGLYAEGPGVIEITFPATQGRCMMSAIRHTGNGLYRQAASATGTAGVDTRTLAAATRHTGNGVLMATQIDERTGNPLVSVGGSPTGVSEVINMAVSGEEARLFGAIKTSSHASTPEGITIDWDNNANFASLIVEIDSGMSHGTKGMAETALASDSLARQVASQRPISETAKASDTLTRLVASSRGMAEVAIAADSISRAVAFERGADMGQAFADDGFSRMFAFARDLSEVAPASDVLGRSISYGRSLDESAPASDAFDKSVAFDRGMNESAPASDAWERGVSFDRSMSENAPASDAWSRLVGYGRGWDDAAPGSDALSRTVAYMRGMAEIARASDTFARGVHFERVLDEVALASDDWFRSVAKALAMVESAPASDTWERDLVRNLLIIASAPATDVFTRTGAFVRGWLDSGAVSDFFHITLPFRAAPPIKTPTRVRLYRHITDAILPGATGVRLRSNANDVILPGATKAELAPSTTGVNVHE